MQCLCVLLSFARHCVRTLFLSNVPKAFEQNTSLETVEFNPVVVVERTRHSWKLLMRKVFESMEVTEYICSKHTISLCVKEFSVCYRLSGPIIIHFAFKCIQRELVVTKTTQE